MRRQFPSFISTGNQ